MARYRTLVRIVAMSDDTYTVALHGWRSWFDFPVSQLFHIRPRWVIVSMRLSILMPKHLMSWSFQIGKWDSHLLKGY
jgi:hypothetical protein